MAEKALLGALLRSDTAYWQISDLLRPDMFAFEIHSQIYAAVADICVAGQKLSYQLVVSRLPEEMKDGQSTAAYVSVLRSNAEDSGSPLDFASDIADLSARRSFLRQAKDLAKAAENMDADITLTATETAAALNDVANSTSPKRPRLNAAFSAEVLVKSKKALETDELPGYSTGFESLDELIGGRVFEAELGFILAAQMDGKTALAQAIAENLGLQVPTLFMSKEMSGEAFSARALSTHAGVSSNAIRLGRLNRDQWRSLQLAQEKIAKSCLYVDERTGLTVAQVRSVAMSMLRRHGVKVVLIDQIDKIKAGIRTTNSFERAEHVTSALKDMAKDLGMAFIVLAQRTRTAQRSDDEVPKISDTDYRSIERDADWVLGLWRRQTFLDRNRPGADAPPEKRDAWVRKYEASERVAGIVNVKARGAKPGMIRYLDWDGPTTTFTEVQ